MSIYQIVEIGDEVLRAETAEVRRFDERLHQLLADMAETMYHAEGVGLAAPQIGISKKIVVIDVGDGLIELVNPVILEKKGRQVGEEGCLSVPGKYASIPRANWVKVKAQATVKSLRWKEKAFWQELFSMKSTISLGFCL